MISHPDHLVLTTRDMGSCLDFYSGILGMEVLRFGAERVALKFGQQKINIHEYGGKLSPGRLCRCRARWIFARLS